MSLPQWSANGWLRPHKTSRQEVDNLLAIADRDLADTQTPTCPPTGVSESPTTRP